MYNIKQLELMNWYLFILRFYKAERKHEIYWNELQ
jgi:hypothetical protein